MNYKKFLNPHPLLFLILLSSSAYSSTPSLEFGPFGQGIVDGTSPFGTDVEDTSGNLVACSSAASSQVDGADCGDNNHVLRSQDVAAHLFSISANGGDPTIPLGDNVVEDVVLEVTATPSADAVIVFDAMPTSCTTLGGGGTNPPSSIVTDANGSITLICNMGGLSEGQAKLLSIPIKPSGVSANGSSYTTTQKIYSAPASDGSATSTVNTYIDSTPMLISAAPAWDLINAGWSKQGTIYRDVGQGLEPGIINGAWIQVAATRKTGIESITEPMTFSSIFSTSSTSASCPGFTPEFHVISCSPNTNGYTGKVYGVGGGDRAVTDSGTCDYVRTDPADNTSTQYDFTITGADLSGTHWPTEDPRGNDLSAGPYYAVNHRVSVFIPLRTIDAADCVEDNNNGSINFSSALIDFDPTSPSDTSNFGTGTEPGYNSELIDGARSNNDTATQVLEIRAEGGFYKFMSKRVHNNATNWIQAVSSNSFSGDGEMENGSSAASIVRFNNNGNVDLNNIGMCDVFDNTTYQLTDRSNVGATAGTYAFIGTYGTGSALGVDDFIIEYANIDLTGDDPLDNNADGSNDFNPNTGRYEGDWSNQQAAKCDDSSATNGWQTDPTAVTGGIDGVNAVRYMQSAASLAAGDALVPSQVLSVAVPLMIRQTFNGGPHAGEIIPPGTVMANFATARSDQIWTNWLSQTYYPSPENTSNRGDRISMSRARLALDSFSLSPAAGSGSSASTLAGNEVVWQINTTLLTNLETPVFADNLQIFSTLPPEASYSATCTALQANATPPNLIQYNTDAYGNAAAGYTRLVWNMGNVAANSPIEPRVFCSDTDPLAADGTSVVLESWAGADDIFSTLALRHDQHAITLLQVGDVKVSKTVDAALDDRNDDQVFTLSWANFSDIIEIDKPVIIDRLPYNGDDNVPSSSFSGFYSLTQEPTATWMDGSTPASGTLGTWYYTSDAPASIVVDPDNNTSNWCVITSFASAGCPADFREVTALKFISNYNLAKNGDVKQGVIAKVTLQAGDPGDSDPTAINVPSDIYTNYFTFDSASLPAAQFLKSGYSAVQVASYSLGDFVFVDMDADGKYDPAIDYPAPNGTIVNLHKSDGTLLQSTTLGLEQNGRYLFQKVDTGDFYVEIPASEFQLGNIMANWAPSAIITDPNTEANETEDHHAFSVSGSLIDGVRSGLITLSADAATPGGGVPIGHEPTADNTAGLTDLTLDDFSNFTLDLGLVGATYEVSGTVWLDANRDGTRQNSESGMPNVTVVLYGAPYDDHNRCFSLETDANGFYQFENILPGNYQLIESDQSAVPFGTTATCPPVEGDPSGYTSTTSNTRSLTVYQTDVRRQDFGDFPGITVSGTVFNDNGAGAGISGNQTQDGAEAGIGDVRVMASDGNGTIYDTTTTATDGSYTLNIPDTATTVVVTEQDKPGYTSTGGDPGSAFAGSYNLGTDSITFPVITAFKYTGLNFADIQGPTFEPDNSANVLPGNVVFYAHTFSTPADGDVTFTDAADLYTTGGWSTTVYHDANCDGQLNGSEEAAAIGTAPLSIASDDKICIINKVYAPNNVISQESHRATLTATFQDTSGSNSQVLTVTDTTTASQNISSTGDNTDASSLVLRKSVQNVTQGTAATETQNEANTGDTLRYRITYRNTGSGPITDVKVNDVVPPFTAYELGSANCNSTPVGMTCVANGGPTSVDWVITGELLGGASGQVSYQIKVDN